VAAPTGLAGATANTTQINLSCQNVTGETGFAIQRSPDGSSGWAQVGTTAAGVLTFQDSGLSAGTAYYYRVEATGAGATTATGVTAAAAPTPPGRRDDVLPPRPGDQRRRRRRLLYRRQRRHHCVSDATSLR
jgi:hypothetical protein